MNHFPNLAGLDDPDPFISRELEEAGITILPLSRPENGEVRAGIWGYVGPWVFKRCWRYYDAEGPGIPPDLAESLHEKFGREVRVDGHCGCPSPREWFKGFAVGRYHVDTARGLKALADTIKGILSGGD